MKRISNVSGIALKLMFLDSIIKAKLNEGENQTIIERMINILMSGIVTITNTSLSSEANDLYYDVQFNSILPDDLKEAVDIAVAAKEAGLLSTKTGVEFIGMNPEVDEEMGRLS